MSAHPDTGSSVAQSVFDEEVSSASQGGSSPSTQSFLSPAIPSSGYYSSTPTNSSTTSNSVTPNVSGVLSTRWRICGQCKNKFRSPVLLERHITEKHPSKPLHCGLPHCPPFADKKSFERHLKYTKPHRADSCSVFRCHCNWSNARWDKFKGHMSHCKAEATALSEYSCVCGQKYISWPELEIHYVEIHRGKRGRPRRCPE